MSIQKEDIQGMDKETILAPETIMEIMDVADPVERLELTNIAIAKAVDLRCKTTFERTLRELTKMATQAVKANNKTSFKSPYCKEMLCGGWVADASGVRIYNPMTMQDIVACPHPIHPFKRLKNMETGEEQVSIAFKRNGIWNEKTVSKEVIASASKIVKLSAYGVGVTSENARDLVRFLADLESYNEEQIPIVSSTSKMGWHGAEFIPYDGAIIFDGDTRFRHLFESITQEGTLGAWFSLVAELRHQRRFEFLFIMASSFASVLLHKIGNLPFFVDLYGETEGGKTVSLMLAASVWGNPSEGKFIGDFKSTEVALEAKADMLNHLPMLLDDTSKTSNRIKDNFEGVIYDLCSGKGKSRSNRDLGLNRENHWENIAIVNGERPLISYVGQGGAINRVLEVECKENLYQDAPAICELIKKNYGHGGKVFVDVIKEKYPDERLKEMFEDFYQQLQSPDKMNKQTMSVACVLVADKILSEEIFQDGISINIEHAQEILMDYKEVSDGERCYQMIIDKVAANMFRFKEDEAGNVEQWGVIGGGYVKFIPAMLSILCDSFGFKYNSFKKWAVGKGIIYAEEGRFTKVARINGSSKRLIWIKLPDEEDFVDWEQVKYEFFE